MMAIKRPFAKKLSSISIFFVFSAFCWNSSCFTSSTASTAGSISAVLIWIASYTATSQCAYSRKYPSISCGGGGISRSVLQNLTIMENIFCNRFAHLSELLIKKIGQRQSPTFRKWKFVFLFFYFLGFLTFVGSLHENFSSPFVKAPFKSAMSKSATTHIKNCKTLRD